MTIVAMNPASTPLDTSPMTNSSETDALIRFCSSCDTQSTISACILRRNSKRPYASSRDKKAIRERRAPPMQYVCDAPDGKTWFRIETESEAQGESDAMNHAV